MMNKFKILVDVPNNKVAIIKMIRDFIDIGLKDAKDFVEAQYTYELALSCQNVALELLVDDEALGRAFRRQHISKYLRSWRYISIEGLENNVADLAYLRENPTWT